jgi:hypothetical protein
VSISTLLFRATFGLDSKLSGSHEKALALASQILWSRKITQIMHSGDRLRRIASVPNIVNIYVE